MKTQPDRITAVISRSGALLAVAALFIGCGASLKHTAPKPPLSERARAFLDARSRPPLVDPVAAKAEETVEILGAVDRPGQLVIGPYAQTLRQGLDAMGGVSPTAATLRIRPGDDELAKLFARVDGGDSAIEISLAAIAPTSSVYLHSGDVIEVVVADAAPPISRSSHDAAASAPAPPPPPVAIESPEVEAAKVPAREGAPPHEFPKPLQEARAEIPAVQEAKGPEAPKVESAGDGDVRAELGVLRGDMEAQLRAVRADLERLQDENAKLRARLELSTRPSPAVVPAPIKKPAAPAERTDSVPTIAAEKAEPKHDRDAHDAGTSRAATVLVSGSVQNPGTYPIDMVKTVRGAVRAAGNRAGANLQSVEVRSDGQRGALIGMGLGLGTAPIKSVVDLTAVENGKSRDVPLRGGEVIFVPPSQRSERPQ